MIKGVSFFACVMMFVSPAISATTNYDPRDSEISHLVAEKQRKYKELEKCVKSTNGLQIAGISTIGLTVAGVSLNIAQAGKKKNLDKQIDATNSQINTKRQELEAKRLQEERERIARNAQIPQNVASTDNSTFIEPDTDLGSYELCEKVVSIKPGTECYQDSAGKWKYRWNVHEGDSCPTNYCFDSTNTATCKYVWVPSEFVCVADTCKPGYKVFGHMCKKENPINCDATKGEVVSISGDSCFKCPEGHIANNGKCEECPSDKKPAGNKCVDFSCPSNMIKSYGECVECSRSDLIPNADQTQCIQKYGLDDFKAGCDLVSGKVVGMSILSGTGCFLPRSVTTSDEALAKCAIAGQNLHNIVLLVKEVEHAYDGEDTTGYYCFTDEIN